MSQKLVQYTRICQIISKQNIALVDHGNLVNMLTWYTHMQNMTTQFKYFFEFKQYRIKFFDNFQLSNIENVWK